MSSKPGRPPVSTSFKKGNTAALGNDKTLRISTWIEKALNKQIQELDPSANVEEYDRLLQAREFLANKLVKKAIKTKDDGMFNSLLREIMDRTEGKPTQPIDHTSKGERIFDNLTDEQLRSIAEGTAGTASEGTD